MKIQCATTVNIKLNKLNVSMIIGYFLLKTWKRIFFENGKNCFIKNFTNPVKKNYKKNSG